MRNNYETHEKSRVFIKSSCNLCYYRGICFTGIRNNFEVTNHKEYETPRNKKFNEHYRMV